MAKAIPFNWEESTRRNAQTAQWLKKIHDQPISEDEFARQYMELPHHSLRTSDRPARKQYHYLKSRFGFFGGSKDA